MGIWSQHLKRYNDVIEESSLDKTYIGPTGKPQVQSKIANLLGHAIQHKHQAGVTFIMFLFILYSRYQCQLSLFLELNFNCHVPTVLGKKFREYSACLSLCYEMFIKLSGHFGYSKAYNRNFTVYFPFTVDSLHKDTPLLRAVHWVPVLYWSVLYSTVGPKDTKGHTIPTSI